VLLLSILLGAASLLSGCEAIEPELNPAGGADEGAVVAPQNEAVTEEGAEQTGTTTEPASEGDSQEVVAGIQAGTLVRGYALMDLDFVNQDGQVSGEIEDFFFDMNSGHIPFVTVEYGGVLDIGDTELAMPLSAFSWQSADEVVLNFDEQALQDFPDLGDDWPDVTNPTWDDEVNSFWSEHGVDPGANIEEASGPLVEASDLTGYTLVDLGAGAGTVQDVLVDLAGGRVKYVLVGFGAGAAADDAYILPLAIFSVTEQDQGLGNELAFDAEVTQEMLLTAPRFDRALYGEDELIEPGLDEQIAAYWQSFGF
jgi:uncharacterized protein YrrD